MFSIEAQKNISEAYNALNKVYEEEHRRTCANCKCGLRGPPGMGSNETDYYLMLLKIMANDIKNLIGNK